MTGSDALAWSYRTGDWYGVLGSRTSVLLPPGAKARAARVWQLVDDGAAFDDVLDALLADGLRDLTGFVLVGHSAAQTRVLVRGAAQAHLAVGEEVVHVAGDPALTWVERVEQGVTRIRLEAGPGGAGAGRADQGGAEGDLTVGGGLVRVASAEHPPVSAAEPEVAVPPGVESVVAEPVAPEPAVVEPVAPEPAATEAVPLAELLDPGADDSGADDSGADDSDHDGDTRAGDPTGALRQLPGIPGQPPAPMVSRPVARLVFTSGETVAVDRVVLVGRAPEPGRVPAGGEPHIVAVPSPHQEISSTHIEIRPGSGADHGSAVVTDLGSTNGTLIRQPGLPEEELRPGVGVQLIPGAVVDLGDGQTIQVVDP